MISGIEKNLACGGRALHSPDKVLSKGKFKGHIQGVFGGQ
jgi:hypothetical protein